MPRLYNIIEYSDAMNRVYTLQYPLSYRDLKGMGKEVGRSGSEGEP